MKDVPAPYYVGALLSQEDPDAPLPAHVLKYAAVRTRPVYLTWMCGGCREWVMNGSYKVGRCTRCGTPRPIDS